MVEPELQPVSEPSVPAPDLGEPATALTPPKLPWNTTRSMADDPAFMKKHRNGSDKRAEWKMKRRPFAGSNWSEK